MKRFIIRVCANIQDGKENIYSSVEDIIETRTVVAAYRGANTIAKKLNTWAPEGVTYYVEKVELFDDVECIDEDTSKDEE